VRADLRQALADDARRRAADRHADPERALAAGIRGLRRRIALGYGAAVVLVVAALTLVGARSDAEPPGSLVTPGPTTTPVALVVDPPEVALAPGESLVLTARATFADGSTGAPDGVVWRSSDDAVVEVVQGVVTARRAGTASVTASWQGVTGSAQVVVQDAPEQPGEVTFAVLPEASTQFVGAEVTLRAVVTAADGSQTDVGAGATWSSSQTKVVQVDPTGRVQAVGVGLATITARWDGREAMAELTVEPEETTPTPAQTDVE
jgi:uncharacterized protein YjdB